MMYYGMFICIVSCVLLFITVLWMRSMKKWIRGQIKSIERNKNELAELIVSAENMLNELNGLSDYIVNQIEEKNMELYTVYNEADSKINEYKNVLEEAKNKNIVRFPNRVTPIGNTSKRNEIMEMLNNGMNISEVSRVLKMGQGEIQLIMGMKAAN